MTGKKRNRRKHSFTAEQRALVCQFIEPYYFGALKSVTSLRRVAGADPTRKTEGDLAYWQHAARALSWVLAHAGWRRPQEAPTESEVASDA